MLEPFVRPALQYDISCEDPEASKQLLLELLNTELKVFKLNPLLTVLAVFAGFGCVMFFVIVFEGRPSVECTYLMFIIFKASFF